MNNNWTERESVGNLVDEEASIPAAATLIDFYSHLPSHQYLYVPTRELWPGASVNGHLPKVIVEGKEMAPSSWLDRFRAVQQLVWHPGESAVITDRLMRDAGWVPHPGALIFNLYQAPTRPGGVAGKAAPWIDHVKHVYPEDFAHIIRWLAHRVQMPGVKCNHALVLGGAQGVGKDTLLEPIKAAVGPWNWSDISPTQMLGRFNGFAKSVILRVNEARDLGDTDRFAFYDHAKVFIAAPPDVLRVDEKHLRETPVVNVCGVIITTNHLGDGLYLPADDRRHYVAWSPRTIDEFNPCYWNGLYEWFAEGGIGHVCEYLSKLDLSDFDPKAPPKKTAAFWTVVSAGDAPESGELRDVLEVLKAPPAVSLQTLVEVAGDQKMYELQDELKDRKNRRALPHKLERVGYVPVRNPDANDGLWKLRGRRQVIYAHNTLSLSDQIRAARKVS